MYLAVFKECFLELVGKIVREDDDLVDISIFYDIGMIADSAEIFEMTLLTKRREISDDGNMVLVDERFLEMWFTVIHDEEYSLLLKPSMSKSVHSNPSDTYSPQDNTTHREEKSIYQDKSWNQNRLIRKSIGQIEETNHDKERDKN